jgi:ubiquitin-protein ligase
MASKLNKELFKDITKLKLLDKDSSEVRFRLKESPFNDDEDEDQNGAQSLREHVVTGQIFPKSEIYRERSYLIEIKLTKNFPMDPPQVRFLTTIYHPNVDTDGKSLILYSIKKNQIEFQEHFVMNCYKKLPNGHLLRL